MIQWTAEQEKAISFQSQGELLVSAAAGSGKTAVLTERILRTCLEGRAALSELAVMTFTDKAAVHMRRALEKKIHERLAETEDSAEREKLRELVKELPLAQISTIHAFCLRLIREYRHELSDEKGEGIQPGRSTGLLHQAHLRQQTISGPGRWRRHFSSSWRVCFSSFF